MDIRVLIKISHPTDKKDPYGVGVYKLTRSGNGSLYWLKVHRTWGNSYGHCLNRLGHLGRNLPVLTTPLIIGCDSWREKANILKLEDFPLEFEDGNN